MCPQILANVIIFICGNVAGAYHKHLMELALQQTYQDTCNCIKSRIKLEFEKRQQVKCSFNLPSAFRGMIKMLMSPLPSNMQSINSFERALSSLGPAVGCALAGAIAKEQREHLQTQTQTR